MQSVLRYDEGDACKSDTSCIHTIGDQLLWLRPDHRCDSSQVRDAVTTVQSRPEMSMGLLLLSKVANSIRGIFMDACIPKKARYKSVYPVDF